MEEVGPIRLWAWSALWARLNTVCDVAGLARSLGALARGRKISDAEDLLHTVLYWAVSGRSLTQVLLTRATLGGAALSKQSLQERLSRCGDWLEAMVAALLAEQRPDAAALAQPVAPGTVVTIVDATCLSRPGARGTEVRLHVLYDLVGSRLLDVQTSDVHGGERLDRFPLRPGEIRLADAGHASPAGLRHVLGCGGHLLMRVGWNSLAWRDGDGAAYDLTAALAATVGDSFEQALMIADAKKPKAPLQPVRLIARRRPPDRAEQCRRRLRAEAKRKGRTPDRRSLIGCDWQILLTTLEAADWPAEQLFQLYAARWQIELAFKRMKSIGGIAEIAMRTPAMLRCWVAAHLVAALLQDRALDPEWRESFPSAP